MTRSRRPGTTATPCVAVPVDPPGWNLRAKRPVHSVDEPHPALVLGYLLGGSLHRPLDRNHALDLSRRAPAGLAERACAIQEHRATVLREVMSTGRLRGVLDLATGAPIRGVVQSAHLALEERETAVSVVYVEPNANLASHVQRWLAGDGIATAAVVCADPADASTTWARVAVTGLLDLAKPVVLDCVGIADRIPDPDRQWHTFAGWARLLSPESVLLLSRPLEPRACDPVDAATDAGWRLHPPTPSALWGTPDTSPCFVLHHPDFQRSESNAVTAEPAGGHLR